MDTQLIQTFDFASLPVRVLMRDDAPWFVAADVCRVLDIANSRDAVGALDDDEKMTVANTDGHSGQRGGAQSFNLISESGLYALIFKSRKPEARKFRKWVTSEVLPAIRQTGQYQPPSPHPVEGLLGPERVSLYEYVRTRLAGWPLRRRIQFGLLTRRYVKAMGVMCELETHSHAGQVLTLPVLVADEVRQEFAKEARLVDSDEAEFERLLEAALVGIGNGGYVATEVLLGIAKTLKLFPKFLQKDSSLQSERCGFGKLIARFNGHTFPSGLRLEAHRNNMSRGYRIYQTETTLAN
jgi:prophage antirepressor-like protein